MSRKQKFLLIALVAVVLTVLGRLFLNSPIAHIQFAAETVGHQIFGKWNITNSLIAAWLAMAILITIAFLATRKMRLVPTGLQNFVEAVIGWLLDLVENVAGKKNGRKFFPLVATIFLFIIVANWSALLPVFGTVGKVETADEFMKHNTEEVVGNLNGKKAKANQPLLPTEYDEIVAAIRAKTADGVAIRNAVMRDVGSDSLVIFNGGEKSIKTIAIGFNKQKEIAVREVWDADRWGVKAQPIVAGGKTVFDPASNTVGELVPYLRSMNTDLMNPLALAIIAMFMIQYWGVRAQGFFRYMSKFINFKGGPIGFVVGILETISEVSRLISFSFRLLGNMFAGEVLIFSFVFLLPVMAGILVMPFILETFVGFIQALIFAALTLLFATLAMEGHEGGHEEGHGKTHEEAPHEGAQAGHAAK